MSLHRALAPIKRSLIAQWSIASLLAIGVLPLVAWHIQIERNEAQLDLDLASFAAATASMVWFDASGDFHGEVLHIALADDPAEFDYWIVDLETDSTDWISSDADRFQLDAASLKALANTATTSIAPVFSDGTDIFQQPYRGCAAVVYQEPNHPRAALIAVADDTKASAQARSQTLPIVGVALLLALGSVWLANHLARRALAPTEVLLEQRERFLAAAAHELRTPVATMRAIVESAQQNDESAQAALNRLSPVILASQKTIESLLLFVRLEAGRISLHLEPVRLDLLVESMDFPGVAAENLELTLEATIAQVDPELIKVAIHNLVANSAKHSNRSNHGNEPVQAAEVRISVSGANIRVQDTGPGFPPAVLETFRPSKTKRGAAAGLSSSRSERPSTSSGLGLAIVQMIAKLHGGSLRLQNLEEARPSPSEDRSQTPRSTGALSEIRLGL